MPIKIKKQKIDKKTKKIKEENYTASSYNWSKKSIKELEKVLSEQGCKPKVSGYYDKKGKFRATSIIVEKNDEKTTYSKYKKPNTKTKK